MNRLDLHEIVMKLTGPVQPVGETNEDERRFRNLNDLVDLTRLLVGEIQELARYEHRPEYSIRRAGHAAVMFLEELREEE